MEKKEEGKRDKKGRRKDEEEEEVAVRAAGAGCLRASPKQMTHFPILPLIPICGTLVVTVLFTEHSSPILKIQTQVDFGGTSGRLPKGPEMRLNVGDHLSLCGQNPSLPEQSLTICLCISYSSVIFLDKKKDHNLRR